jgi:hypothetical protein
MVEVDPRRINFNSVFSDTHEPDSSHEISSLDLVITAKYIAPRYTEW